MIIAKKALQQFKKKKRGFGSRCVGSIKRSRRETVRSTSFPLFLFFSHIGTPNFPEKKKASHCGMVACDGRYFGDGLEAQFEIHTAKLRNKKPPVAATINANPSFSLNPSPPLSVIRHHHRGVHLAHPRNSTW